MIRECSEWASSPCADSARALLCSALVRASIAGTEYGFMEAGTQTAHASSDMKGIEACMAARTADAVAGPTP